MTTYLGNAFSLNMLKTTPAYIYVSEMTLDKVKEYLTTFTSGFTSIIGHETTAKILTQLLGIQIPVNRIPIQLDENDELIVFQLLERMPEGKVLTLQELKQLVEQGKVKFFFVKITR